MTFELTGIISVFGNYCVIRIFGSTPSLRTPSNMLVMNLAVSDLLLVVTMFPEMIYNFWAGGPWRQGETICYAHAFCGNFLQLAMAFSGSLLISYLNLKVTYLAISYSLVIKSYCLMLKAL